MQKTRNRNEERAEHWLRLWSERLDIRCPVRMERTSIWQVATTDGRRGCSLVGVVLHEEEACIYHTRRLTEEDIVHELLHVAHPAWSEAEVVFHTARILSARRPLRRQAAHAAVLMRRLI